MKTVEKIEEQLPEEIAVPIAKQLPEPSGYRILIALPEAD